MADSGKYEKNHDIVISYECGSDFGSKVPFRLSDVASRHSCKPYAMNEPGWGLRYNSLAGTQRFDGAVLIKAARAEALSCTWRSDWQLPLDNHDLHVTYRPSFFAISTDPLAAEPTVFVPPEPSRSSVRHALPSHFEWHTK